MRVFILVFFPLHIPFSGQERKGTGWCRKEEKNQPIGGCKCYSEEGVREENVCRFFFATSVLSFSISRQGLCKTFFR